MIEFDVKAVIKEPLTGRYNVILECVDNVRVLPVPVGEAGAKQIFKLLNSDNLKNDDPFSMTAKIIELSGSSYPERVVVESYDEGVFRATFCVIINGAETCMDCRPSDAFALAITTNTPVYVSKSVLDSEVGKKIHFYKDFITE